jgi:uncharacterized protein
MRYCQSMTVPYQPRFADLLLDEMLADHPAVLITGPRACGKTTTAARHAATVIRLDREREAEAFHADPDSALLGLPEPILLDEWPVVPGVLGAVKRAVDSDPRRGRFIVTGSVRGDIDGATWPGTGRLIRLPMFGVSLRERRGNPLGKGLVDNLIDGTVPDLPADLPDLRGYVEIALQSGFPEPALGPDDPAARQRWLTSYIDQVVTRDAEQVADRDPVRMRRFFDVYAASSAGIANDMTLVRAAGINRRTAVAYENLLANLLLIDRIPAWTSNRLTRLTKAPKRHLVDPALIAGALQIDVNGVMRDGDLLGRIIESFVVAQFRAEHAINPFPHRFSHLRQDAGRREIDLIIEPGGGRVIAVEAKATGAPKVGDARHLQWLRDEVGDAFVAGLVMHTGPRAYSLGDRITAMPIAALWGSGSA